jgi:hypothetical protein
MLMRSPRRCGRRSCTGLLLAACLLLAGCNNTTKTAEETPVNRNVTRENFDRIKQDMTFKEVHDLLGPSQTLRIDEDVQRRDGKVSGRAIEVRRWRDGDSSITVTFNFGKVASKEGHALREEAEELRSALVGKWSQSTAAELSKTANTYTFLASGELQAQMSRQDQGGGRVTAGGTWKIEGKTLTLDFTTTDPPSAKLKGLSWEIVTITQEKLIFKKDGKEVTLFRVS